ncbi:glycosyltransferase family 87 protein [Pararhodobacter oceanensis]|uniref:glycosyltransferase family 87 protein n=1 Tax=Pararhodobacter oceanensis TaxID=2172121 RepID=UPI003A919243
MPAQTPPPAPKASLAARLLTGLIIAVFFTVIVQLANLMPVLGAHNLLVDFDAFYIVGQLAWEGRAAEAYDSAAMARIQRALVSREGFMPWTYPPQFDLLAMLLPALPRGIAYALFTGITLAAYLWVLARLAGREFIWILIALAPPIYVTITIGQNAFLTGALMGLFVLATCASQGNRCALAGWPLGLLVLKPHLGIGLGIHALAAARWRVLALAIGIALATSALATWVLGPEIWAAFLAGVRQASEALRTGFYPLFRMTSLYAALHTAGLAPSLALAAQATIGIAACAAIALAVRRGLPLNQTLAMACFTSALVSPYLYDYDMVVTGIGLALIAPDLRARSTWFDRAVLLALIWVAGGWGMIHAIAGFDLPEATRAANARATFSYGAIAYLLVLALLFRILRRPKMT